METLLPSEIARLVLGYLEGQECIEAAKMFLETSPHLQECRNVISNGRRFSTRVSGMSLIDVVETFFVINATIQERLSKIADCEQQKYCRDLLEQLKFLIEETRKQHFVVNINVPSQVSSQTCSGSPIISSSSRKRRHSNSDRERCKHIKIISDMSQQPKTSSTPAIGFNSVETTPLESLPGHTDTSNRSEYTVTIKGKKCNNSLREHQGDNQDVQNLETDIVVDNACKEDCIKSSCPFAKCSAATSTEELLSYSCVEVQTTPYDTPESESESNDEPIENLSLLTKELLNRTELQERIADNINKAILPTDTSLKDETLNDSVNGEGNTSIVIELNNAIKSIVKATETDPVFEKFLDEIIGPQTETDNTSPDEDIEVARPKTKCLNGSSREKQLSEIISNNLSSPEPPTILDIKSSNEIGTTDVPLKHRLRSSSRQQNTRVEDEQRDSEKEYSALDDQNAAAVLSIINANIVNNKPTNDKRMIVDIAKDVVRLMDSDNEKKLPAFELTSKEDKQTTKSTSIDNQRGDNNDTMTVQSNDMEPKIKKSFVKRPRPAKSKRELETNANNYTPEQDIMTMPTLIVCSKEEISNIVLATSTSYPSTRPITSTTNSRFIPIVPKDPTIGKDFVETLYLKTVNVPQKLPPVVPNIPDDSKNVISHVTLQTRQKRKTNKIDNKRKTTTVQSSTGGLTIGNSIGNSIVPTANKFGTGESITLYSNENSSRTLLDGSNMPTINIDDNVSLSSTGLSPYVKFNCSKGNHNQSLSDIDLTPITQAPNVTAPLEINVLNDQSPSTSKNTERDIINKRTPRSLLKSRSKNHRLSLSTPRRRSSSHVRALDFNTPTKIAAVSNRSMSENENTHFSPRSSKHMKSVRRTSLFKSPPFSNTTMSANKMKRTSPKICRPLKPPIATRSPMPKLIGGWEKYNGVGMIIDDVSPQKNLVIVSPLEDTTQIKQSKVIKDTWDADLRKSLQVAAEDECQTTKTEQTKDKTIASRRDKCNTRILKGKKGNSTSKDAVDAKNDRVYEEQITTESKIVENPSNALLVEKDLPDAQHINHIDNNNTQKDTSQPCVVESQNISEEKNTNKLPLETNQQDATTTATTTNDSSAQVKKTVKKYAQLKTLKTNLNKCNAERKDTVGSNLTSTDIVQYTEFAKSSVDITRQMLQLMPELVNLEETPRKFETLSGVPPTPRLLSPSSNATPFIKSNEDSSKLRSFINTPEFPTTPCISLTPKLSEETITNDTKKDAFNTCSPYYKPTSEQNEGSEKLSKSKSANSLQNSSTLPSQSLKLCIPQNIISSTNTYQACVSAKLEITQFEVIKENLPKEDAVKELKISTNSRDSTHYVKFRTDRVKDGIVEHKCAIIGNDKSLIHNEESNGSDTSTSSNSSSTSSSSSSSTSSSSSSSSVSSNKSTAKNLSEKSSLSKKCNRISNQIYTDTSNDSTRKGTHVMETVISDNNSELRVSKITDIPCTDHTEEEIITLRKCESSPLKVFSIAKTDEELKTGTVETPAKDETLLNEADISETPNSSKTGVESLTNLSSKIAAFISSEDRKLSKSSQDLFVENSTRKLKQKSRIVSVQRAKSNSSIAMKKPIKNLKRSVSLTADEKLAMELEAKRQRMIAKFRESPKSNLRGKSQRGRAILKGKGNANPRKRNTQYKCGQVNGDQFSTKRKKKKNVNVKESNNNNNNNNNNKEMIVEHLPADNVAKIEKCSSETVEVKNNVQYPVASSSVVYQNKTSHNEEIVRTEPSTIKTVKHTDIEAKNESKKVIYALVEDVANDVEIAASREKSLDAFDTENKICNSNTAENNEIATKLEAAANLEIKRTAIGAEDNSMHDSGEYSLDMRKSGNDEMISEITSQDSKSDTIKNEHNYNEKNVRKLKEYSNHNGKTNILKSKVDQVKRDLFSDEENDKTSNSIKSSTNQEVKDIVQILQVSDTVKSPTENTDPENPKNLSRVLQSLQLVPTCKNDHAGMSEHGQEDDCKTNDVISVPNSVEYHFLYDDNTPLKKRRRRCSSHELEFQINIVLNDLGCDECVKIMTATDYEEIFNLPPKSRKRFTNKKSPVKNENVCESLEKVFFSPLTMKNIHDKPLATSSPLDKPLAYKVKKGTVKTIAINEKNNEVQYDSKKKPKMDKTTREIDKDNSTGKISRRKLSEVKESKQVEKRQYTTDPQTLLNNLDLDKFLTSVHGPA